MRMNDPKEREIFDAQEPWIYRQHGLAHYYGDIVRQLLLLAAAVLLVGAPFYSADLPSELPFDVIGALVLVCLAAFTSPTNRLIILADTVAAGVGMVLFELWALTTYGETSIIVSLLRQAIALLFLFALYFGGKTLRGLSAGERIVDEEEVDQSEEFAGDGTTDDEFEGEEMDDEDRMDESHEDRDD